MAGIGFELRKALDSSEGVFTRMRAYASASLISCGPWIMTVLTLAILSLFGGQIEDRSSYEMFRGILTYSFAFSLVIIGLFQMSVTRWVADRLYTKAYGSVLPGFMSLVAVVAPVQAVIGMAYCTASGFDKALSFATIVLFVIISITWIALIWLTVIREYDDVLRAYVYGMLATLSILIFFDFTQSTLQLLTAYTAGQALTLLLLVRSIIRGMETGGSRSFDVLGSVRRYARLALIGFAYHVAIWVDKFAFWFLDGTGPHPLVKFHPFYDNCTFLAYLTVVPALAINLVRLETSFYESYRLYYGAIIRGAPLNIVEEKRSIMMAGLRSNFVRLLKSQGLITGAAIYFAPFLVAWLGFPETSVSLLRLSFLGAFFHVSLLITMTTQLYFDLQKEALITTLVFLVLNAGLSILTLELGVAYYGLGYATASLVALFVAYALLAKALERLEYLTFTRQPVDADEPSAA